MLYLLTHALGCLQVPEQCCLRPSRSYRRTRAMAFAKKNRVRSSPQGPPSTPHPRDGTSSQWSHPTAGLARRHSAPTDRSAQHVCRTVAHPIRRGVPYLNGIRWAGQRSRHRPDATESIQTSSTGNVATLPEGERPTRRSPRRRQCSSIAAERHRGGRIGDVGAYEVGFRDERPLGRTMGLPSSRSPCPRARLRRPPAPHRRR